MLLPLFTTSSFQYATRVRFTARAVHNSSRPVRKLSTRERGRAQHVRNAAVVFWRRSTMAHHHARRARACGAGKALQPEGARRLSRRHHPLRDHERSPRGRAGRHGQAQGLGQGLRNDGDGVPRADDLQPSDPQADQAAQNQRSHSAADATHASLARFISRFGHFTRGSVATADVGPARARGRGRRGNGRGRRRLGRRRSSQFKSCIAPSVGKRHGGRPVCTFGGWQPVQRAELEAQWQRSRSGRRH